MEPLLPEDQLAKVLVAGQQNGTGVPGAIQDLLVRYTGIGFRDREDVIAEANCFHDLPIDALVGDEGQLAIFSAG